MNDYKGSVAEQNVSIQTAIAMSTVIGGNFFESILYVTDRFESFGGDTPTYPVVTKDSYSDVLDAYAYLSATEKKIIKANLASLYSYGNAKVYIIPSTEIANYKLYAYWTYLDLEYVVADGTSTDYELAASAETTIANAKDFDKDFTQLICDFPIDPSKARGADTTTLAATYALFSAKTIDALTFVRPALPSGTAGSVNAYLDGEGNVIGYSPALYQLGRTLMSVNESGTPVANPLDMQRVTLQNVLPTASTDPTELMGASKIYADYFKTVNLNYFKPAGIGNGEINNMGGWTSLGNCADANWIVAYVNFMTRVNCAMVMTTGKAKKNAATYQILLSGLNRIIGAFLATGAIENYKNTAPNFADLPKSNGSTIVIPNAWSAEYIDSLRNVTISGTLTVNA